MKKIFNLHLFFTMALLAAFLFGFSFQAKADAYQQAEDLNAGSYYNTTSEEARAQSGYGFDTASDSSVVDLTGAGEHPTPTLFDRDKYVPKKYRSLKTTPPPMP